MFSHSYFTLTVRRLFSDGRNEPRSNYAAAHARLVRQPRS